VDIGFAKKGGPRTILGVHISEDYELQNVLVNEAPKCGLKSIFLFVAMQLQTHINVKKFDT
jgi:hypothetical protein